MKGRIRALSHAFCFSAMNIHSYPRIYKATVKTGGELHTATKTGPSYIVSWNGFGHGKQIQVKWAVKPERALFVSPHGHCEKNFVALCLTARQLTEDE